MLQVSRANNLKIPKTIENVPNNLNSVEDKIEVKKALAMASDEKFSIQETIVDDEELKKIQKIPFNANDLIVITAIKKLGAYVIAVRKNLLKSLEVFL